MPRPRPETQEQVDKTEGERGLSPLPEALSGQPSPGWKPQNILHMCACVCTWAQPHRGIYTPVHAHTSHMDTATHGQTHAAHTHTGPQMLTCGCVCAHRCVYTHVHVCVWVHVCACVCTCTHHACMQPHVGRHKCMCAHAHA